MSKQIKITLSDKAIFYLDWIIENDGSRYRSVAIEELITARIKKMAEIKRPVYKAMKDLRS